MAMGVLQDSVKLYLFTCLLSLQALAESLIRSYGARLNMLLVNGIVD
jgi:hypothetical protein